MRKRRKSNTEESIDPPMAPMIDVVFLLLIFFIATFKENKVEAHLAINMPSPSKTRSEDKPPTLFEVYILPFEPVRKDPATGMTVNRFLLMGTKQVTIDKLEEKLIHVATVDPDQTVMIKVHPSATENGLVQVLDRCGKAGLSQLNVLTLKE